MLLGFPLAYGISVRYLVRPFIELLSFEQAFRLSLATVECRFQKPKNWWETDSEFAYGVGEESLDDFRMAGISFSATGACKLCISVSQPLSDNIVTGAPFW